MIPGGASLIEFLEALDIYLLRPGNAHRTGQMADRLLTGNTRYFQDLMAKVEGDYPLLGIEYDEKMIGGPAFIYRFPFTFRKLEGFAEGIAPVIHGQVAQVDHPTITISSDNPPLLSLPRGTGILVSSPVQPTVRQEKSGTEVIIEVSLRPWSPKSTIPEPIRF